MRGKGAGKHSYFGMTCAQATVIGVLAVLAGLVIILGSMWLYASSPRTSRPVQPVPTRMQVRVATPTRRPYATATPRPTARPTALPSSTPAIYVGDAGLYLPRQDEMPAGYVMDPNTSGTNTFVYPPHSDIGLLSNEARFFEDDSRLLDQFSAWGVYFHVKVYDTPSNARLEFEYWGNREWVTEDSRLDKIKSLDIPGMDEDAWLIGMSRGLVTITSESRIVFRKANVTGMVILFGHITDVEPDAMEAAFAGRMQEAGNYVSLIAKKLR